MIDPDQSQRMASLAPSQTLFTPDDPRQQPPVSSFSSLLNDIDRTRPADDTALKSAILPATQLNPNDAAQAIALGRDQGVPGPVAVQNKQQLKMRAILSDIDRRNLPINDPLLADFLSKPDHAMVAYDQLDNLEQSRDLFNVRENLPRFIELEQQARAAAGNLARTGVALKTFDGNVLEYAGEAATEAGKALATAQDIAARTTPGMAFGAGQQQSTTARRAYRYKSRGNITKAEIAEIDAYMERADALYEETGGGFVTGSSRIVGQMYQPFKEAITAGSAAGTMAGLYMAASETVPPQIAMGPAFTAGFAVSFAGSMYEEMSGVSYYKMRKEGVDEGTAQFMSTIVGAINASLEFVGFAPLIGQGAKTVGRIVTGKVVQEVSKRTVARAAGTAGLQVAANVGTEVVTEVSQEVVEAVGLTVAQMWDGNKRPMLFTEEGREELYDSIAQVTVDTAEGMLLLSLPGPALGFGMNARAIRRSKKLNDRIGEIYLNVEQGELAKRDPEAAKRFYEQRSEGTSFANLYIEASQVDVILRNAEMDPRSLDGIFPGFSTRLEQALASNGDIHMTSAEFLPQLAMTPVGQAMKAHIRVANPENLSPAEVVRAQEEARAAIQRMRDTSESRSAADVAFAESAGRVEDQLNAMIAATGKFSPEQSRTLTDLHLHFVISNAPRVFRTDADGNKVALSPEEFFETFKYSILGPEVMGAQPAAPAKTEDVVVIRDTFSQAWERGDYAGMTREEAVEADRAANEREKAELQRLASEAPAGTVVTGVDNRRGADYIKTATGQWMSRTDGKATSGVALRDSPFRESLAPPAGNAVRFAYPQPAAGLAQQQAPAPDAGVFDANNPPAPLADGQPIVAVLTSDGEVLYDRNATMHGDLAEKFPDKADLIIDGGFIVDGQYQMGQSRGGWSALEGEPDQVALAEQLAAKANERRPQVLEQQPVAPQQPTLAKLQMQAKRGIRRQARKVDLSEAEETAVADAAAEFGESVTEIREAVLAHKKAHPTAQGWAGLEFVGIKPKSDSDKGKKGLGLSKLDLKYRQIPYGFSNDVDGDALVVGSPEYQAAMTAMARRMVEEVRSVAQRAAAGDQNAIKIINQSTWYRAMRTALRREFGGLGDLFADLLGATSPNTPVRGNWEFAVDVLRRASRGDFDVQITQWEEWVSEVERLETELRAYINGEMQAMEARGERPTQAAIKRKPEYATRLAALKAARELPDNLVPRQENGQKYGFNGKNIVRAMVGLWRTVREQNVMLGTSAQAPKALNFSGNLIGFRSRATIDVWAARMLQRLAGLLRIPSMAEGGVSGDMLADGTTTLQFGFGQDVFADAAQRIRADPTLSQDPQLAQLNDDDLQALVWFIEKELWTINSWTSVAGEGGSFELEASLTGTSDRARVRSLRKIIDAGVPSKLQAAARSLPAAQQAKIRWYLDPRKAGWRQRIEAIRAELDAVPTTLPKKDQRAMRAEIRERLDAAIRKSGLARIDRNINAAVRADAKVAVIEEKRKAAQAELISMERRVDRFTAGLSQQQSMDSQGVDYVPTDADQARLAERVRTRAYQADSEGRIVAVKAMSTEGRYGSIERSIDLEAVVQEGWSPVELWRAMVEEARNARQESTFLSRVLRDGEAIDPARHRPGLEIYFKSPIPRDKLDALIEKLNANGVDFFTVIVDARRSTEARSGAMADAVGIRMQYVPEYMQRYGIEDFSGLSEADIASRVKAKEAEWTLLADQVRRVMPEVSFAGVFWHETRVAFADAYESEINAITTGTATGVGGLPAETQWAGQSTSEGLAAADRFVKSRAAPTQPDGAGQVPGGVQEGDRVGLAQPAADTTLKQEAVPGEPSEPQGTFDIDSFEMRVNKSGNVSTLIHEGGHYWLEVMGRMALDPNATPEVASDFDAIMRWFGIEGATPAERAAKWNSMSLEEKRPHHESFARNMEIWTYEGKAPSVELQPAFERFARWLKRIYVNIRDVLNAQYREQFGKDMPLMSPEVRGVFERMFASQEQIERARTIRSAMAQFETQEQSGMDDATWAEYQRMVAEEASEAEGELRKATMAELKWLDRARAGRLREMQRETDKRREEVRAEVETDLSQQRVYRAREFLKRGVYTDESGETQVADTHKLDLEAVKRMYELEPEELRPNLAKMGYGKLGMLAKEGGMDPDVAAEMLGYESADQMIRDLLESPSLEEAVEAETNRRMVIENGELNTPEQRQEAVDRALHTEVRSRLVAVELRWMAKATQPVRVMVAAAKALARGIIGGKRIRDIRPREYVSAEARAAKDARAAFRDFPDPEVAGRSAYTRSMNEQASAIAAGMPVSEAEAIAQQAQADAVARSQARIDEFKAKYPAQEPAGVAIAAKRQEMLNNQLAREALAAREEVDKALVRFRRLFKADKDIAKTRDMILVAAARAILAAHGLGRADATPDSYIKSIKEYNPDLYAEIEPVIAAASRDAQDYRSMTMDEFRNMRDAVEALWFNARRNNQMMVEGKMVAVEQVVSEMNARMEEMGVPKVGLGERNAVTQRQKTFFTLGSIAAVGKRVEHWARSMDGRSTNAFTKYIYRVINDAAVAYQTARLEFTGKYAELVKGVTFPKGRYHSEHLNYTFGMQEGGSAVAEILGAMQHMGNRSNLEKLLLGRGWAEVDENGNMDTSRWDAFLEDVYAKGLITKEHLDFLQATWDLCESMKPLAQRAHYDVFGFYFKEIEPTPVMTPFGEYRGGYVPAARDRFMVPRSRQLDAMDDLTKDFRNAMPSVNRGFTYERTGDMQPLTMDVMLMTKHIDEVVKFAYMQPAVKDVLKIINNREFKQRLNKLQPSAITDLLTPWLVRSATQTNVTAGLHPLGDKFWSWVRSRRGASIMFANLRNAMQQFTGWGPSLLVVDAAHLGAAHLTYTQNPWQTANRIAEASPFMNLRMRGQMLETYEQIADLVLKPNLYQKSQKWSQKHGYFLQTMTQNIVDIVTWTGAYNQSLEQSGKDATDAEAHRQAVADADSAVRLSQGSLNPQDVSRLETGTPFYRTFMQFTTYFNNLANLNVSEYNRTVRGMGFRGTPRLLYIYMMGWAVPMIMSEVIVKGLGGALGALFSDDDDERMDAWLNLTVYSQLRAAGAIFPPLGVGVQLAVGGFTAAKYDDRMTQNPSMAALERGVGGSAKAFYEVVLEDKEFTGQHLRDGLTLLSLLTGIPLEVVSRPAGYAIDVERGNIEPTDDLDYIRGLITGAASPDSRR